MPGSLLSHDTMTTLFIPPDDFLLFLQIGDKVSIDNGQITKAFINGNGPYNLSYAVTNMIHFTGDNIRAYFPEPQAINNWEFIVSGNVTFVRPRYANQHITINFVEEVGTVYLLGEYKLVGHPGANVFIVARPMNMPGWGNDPYIQIDALLVWMVSYSEFTIKPDAIVFNYGTAFINEDGVGRYLDPGDIINLP